MKKIEEILNIDVKHYERIYRTPSYTKNSDWQNIEETDIESDETMIHFKQIKSIKDYQKENYQDYIFHYTDSKSAFNIICDGFIFPYSNCPKLLTKKPKKYIFLTSIHPDNDDLVIIKNVYDLKSSDIYNNLNKEIHLLPLFGRINYAFGIKKNILDLNLLEKVSIENDVWKYDKEIDLNNIKFILVYRKFKYSFKNET